MSESKIVYLPEMVTVGQLAEKVDVSIPALIKELFKNGVMVTVNEKIDLETAQIIINELGIECSLEPEAESAKAGSEQELARAAAKRAKLDGAKARPPIVAVMGHVDHGKTTLLDTISGQKVASGESGGITQHINAFVSEHKGRKITFLDTPGHEAFSAIREHGARLTDLVVLVVAADDGVKPQTEEVVKYASKSGVKIMVAINKVDKTGVDTNKVKQQLSELGLMPEDWGGDTVYVEVSALKNLGIDQLLDMILLLTDVDERLADFEGKGEGLVIEAYLDKSRGPVARLLVEHGQVKVGDYIVSGSSIGKIRSITDAFAEDKETALPSDPVIAYGFKSVPRFGDRFKVVSSKQEASKLAEQAKNDQENASRSSTNKDILALLNKSHDKKYALLIVKADAQGSLKSIIDAVSDIGNSSVGVRIIGQGVGAVNERDVIQAEAAGGNAMIIGFNADISNGVANLADRKTVRVKNFKIIYELVDYITNKLETMIEAVQERQVIGKMKVKGIFHSTQNSLICGGLVVEGEVRSGLYADILRSDEVIYRVAEVAEVKIQQQDVSSVSKGEMCGISLNTTGKKYSIKIDDEIEFYEVVETKEELNK